MAYQISYGQTMVKNHFHEKGPKKKSKITAYIVVFCLVFALVYAAGVENVKHFLFPGDREVTETALTAFAEDLKEGEGIHSAFKTFCEEIIRGADIS